MLKFLKSSSDTITGSTFVQKFFNKKIIVIGSGPSVNLVNWKNLEHDCVLTTSFFYLNDEIRNLSNITHITLTDLVQLDHSNLLDFLDRNPTCTVAFEPKSHPFYETSLFKEFTTTYKNRIVYYNTVYGKKEGVAGRLCYFALQFTPSTLYYVGIDGKSSNPQNDPLNAFRSNLRGDADGYDQKDFVESHIYFADNLFNLSKETGTAIYNLGEGFEFNCSTPYSKEHFPLSDNIKQLIKL